jgi:hypothetical protein
MEYYEYIFIIFLLMVNKINVDFTLCFIADMYCNNKLLYD